MALRMQQAGQGQGQGEPALCRQQAGIGCGKMENLLRASLAASTAGQERNEKALCSRGLGPLGRPCAQTGGTPKRAAPNQTAATCAHLLGLEKRSQEGSIARFLAG